MNNERGIHWERTSGDSWDHHGFRVTPEAQALSIRLPIGGFIWNRPVAVRVEKDGESRLIAVRDVTRIAQFLIWATAMLITVIAWLRRA